MVRGKTWLLVIYTAAILNENSFSPLAPAKLHGDRRIARQARMDVSSMLSVVSSSSSCTSYGGRPTLSRAHSKTRSAYLKVSIQKLKRSAVRTWNWFEWFPENFPRSFGIRSLEYALIAENITTVRAILSISLEKVDAIEDGRNSIFISIVLTDYSLKPVSHRSFRR